MDLLGLSLVQWLITRQNISMQKNRQKNRSFLLKRHTKIARLVSFWNQKVLKYQQARLIVALLFLASLVPLSMSAEARWGYLVSAALLITFIFLVYRTKHFVRFRDSLTLYLAFISRQSSRLQGLPSGRTWKTAHEKAQALNMIPDLGITGPQSLWTLLDETLTEAGQDELLTRIRSTPKELRQVKNHQELIQSLRPLRWFYTKLGLILETKELEATKTQLLNFIQTPATPESFTKVLALNLIIWVPTALLFTLGFLKVLTVPNWVFAIFPLVSWLSLGSVTAVFSKAVGLSHYLSVLIPLLSRIEKKDQQFSGLKKICPQLITIRPSKQIQSLERTLGFLGTQTNPLLHFVVNALTPWTLVSVYFLEKIRLRLQKDFPTVLQELADLEVTGSLLIFDKYQSQTYPTFENNPTLKCQKIFHPLIDQSKVVANDFSFLTEESLGLLTGSNMSGKSTFLRTVGLNQILANMGAPVFADSLQTGLFKIETCIEVSDSLRDGYSYFYSEVRRLKSILQECQSHTPVLYLIDEIFRGTNNRERQVGSRSVITQLAQIKTSLGFVSTHDLELTSLSDQNRSVVNLHFKESIDANGKMSFSYELNQGPCPTTNALRIMESEGLIQTSNL